METANYLFISDEKFSVAEYVSDSDVKELVGLEIRSKTINKKEQKELQNLQFVKINNLLAIPFIKAKCKYITLEDVNISADSLKTLLGNCGQNCTHLVIAGNNPSYGYGANDFIAEVLKNCRDIEYLDCRVSQKKLQKVQSVFQN